MNTNQFLLEPSHPTETQKTLVNRRLTAKTWNLAAGPCAIEDFDTTLRIAKCVKAAGGHFLRGGAYKPRTHPDSFRGLEEAGLLILKECSRLTGLPVITEVMDTRQVERVAEHADILQIGSRNMQNFPLLTEVGRQPKPVLLKRGMGATVEEFLGAVEYILREGNEQVILCERGIRAYSSSTRATLDLAVIPLLRAHTTLPIWVDPSHAAGESNLVESMAMAATAAGADGLLIEVHTDPATAWCDAQQALPVDRLTSLVPRLARIRSASQSD